MKFVAHGMLLNSVIPTNFNFTQLAITGGTHGPQTGCEALRCGQRVATSCRPRSGCGSLLVTTWVKVAEDCFVSHENFQVLLFS